MSVHKIIYLATVLLFAPATWAQAPEYSLGVDGMSCPFCVYGLEKQLKKLEGVTGVETDLEQGEILVSMKDGETLQRDSVDQAVTRAGFTMRFFKETSDVKTP